ncbi:MAG: ABC-F family ATP-binding cassette domain-containing protein [Spirochaetes bacterium]|nr:ABC-F family ATP-binding cassette domain-containing protein [Spirochaetota bacterium]MBN2770961.1 ABC-F family ATP-binding cassette domain-containing protein [Spirochaetota bacterium]
MLIVKNLSKSYGSKPLFLDASFTLTRGEKAGLVGRNGHGKTTLFRIITGKEEADSGTIETPSGYRIGAVEQHLNFSHDTAVNEAASGLSDPDEKWKAEKILSGLGFSEQDMQKNPSTFSGGFQVRINLAKALLSEPDLMLLDEPTNYLDITSIRWLIQFLKTWQNELILITHDRSFMDSVITHTISIHRAAVKKIVGNTEKMYQQIIKEEEITEKTRVNDEKRRKEVQKFIDQYRSKARIASRVQSRIKMLDKMSSSERLAAIEELDFSFNEAPFSAKTLLTVENISFGYDKPLFSNLGFSVQKGDRICIIGKNGKGKTTLLKVLAGVLKPDTGEIHTHQQTKSGYFEQTNISSLDPNRTVEQEIAASGTGEDAQLARNIAGSMMFKGDDALKKVSVLSGGEKARVMLGKIVIQPANLLLLDEPTNHFDIQSCDSLIEALDSYEGAVIMVTHNEMFLRAIAQKLIIFNRDRVQFFNGTYDDFLQKYGWEEEDTNKFSGNIPADSAEHSESQKLNNQINPKEARKIRSEIIRERSETLKPLEKEIENLENIITKTEEKLEEIQQTLITASQSDDGSAIQKLSIESHNLNELLEKSFDSLEKTTLEYEAKKADFEERLISIGQQ